MTSRSRSRARSIARRVVGCLVVLVALVAGALVPPPPEPEASAWQPVASTRLVCPELAVPDGSASVVTGLVADPSSA